MQLQQRHSSRFHQRTNGLIMAMAILGSTAIAAYGQTEKGEIEPLPATIADQVTTDWNPSLFPKSGFLIYAAQTQVPYGYIPGQGLGHILMERPTAVNQPLQTFRLRIGRIFDIQSSPDSRYVLLKVGDMIDAQDGYSFYLWNRRKKEPFALRKPPQSSAYPRVFWSPNSRYLAFYNYTRFDAGMGVVQALTVYDFQSERSYPITIPYVQTDVAWSARNTLLFIAPKPETTKAKVVDDNHQIDARGDLHELDIQKLQLAPATVKSAKSQRAKPRNTQSQSVKSRLVIENADGPMAESPDGRWLAFQGLPHPSDSKEKLFIPNFDTEAPAEGAPVKVGNSTGLYLFDRQDKKRYCIADMTAFTPSDPQGNLTYLRWSPDGRKLIATVRAAFFEVDLVARKVRRLARAVSKNAPDMAQERNYENFEPLTFSSDNSVLLLKSEQYKEFADVMTINLKSGALATVARIENAKGVAWANEQSIAK